ncbi:MAG TPA: cellulase family glycosylhydrolase [Actinomycetota bacterium]|nr:cellulase family glycosylhydrolase [Actinomycetota bacterium]
MVAATWALSPVQGATTAPVVKVSGHTVVSSSGAPIRIAGVNRSGSEYACAQGWGFFDGPTDDTSIAAMTAWNINAVRVPLNEDCWLGINGVNAAYAGANYQSAIRAYVTRLQAHGLDVVLDLHWGAAGSQLALGQEQAPDADHAPAFWSSVAAAYKGVNGILFDLFNEPHDISWSCWLNGCTTPAGWKATGMQQLVNAVRGAGATQPVIAEGLNWGGDLSGWLANRPTDSQNQLAAGWHIYNFSGCNTTSCWNSAVAPVAQQVPVLATEVGENDCAGGFLNTLLPWADAHSIGYLAWAWDTASCTGGPALISNYNGTPTGFGAAYKSWLASSSTPPPAPASTTPAPTASPTTSPTPTTPPPPTTQPLDPNARFDFEDGTIQGWSVEWGTTLGLSNESGTAASGSHGLAMDISGNGFPAAGVSTGLTGAAPGSVVTYHVYAPGGVAASVQPVVYDTNWNTSVLGTQTLSAGWNTVTFTVPAINGVRIIGLQVDDSSGWAGRLVLDDVTWQGAAAPPVFDFEDGTTQSWTVRWGSTVALSNESGTAFTGTHGLAMDVSGTGFPGIGETAHVAGLTAGSPVHYEVWAPSGVGATVSPVVFDANWNATVLGAQTLVPGWNSVNFNVPAGISSLQVLGLQVNDPNGWTGRLVLDSVFF